MKCTAVGSTGSGACLDAVPSAYSAMGFMTVHTASFTATTYRILKFANESCWVYNPTGTSYAPTASMGIAVGTTIFINLDCWN